MSKSVDKTIYEYVKVFYSTDNKSFNLKRKLDGVEFDTYEESKTDGRIYFDCMGSTGTYTIDQDYQEENVYKYSTSYYKHYQRNEYYPSSDKENRYVPKSAQFLKVQLWYKKQCVCKDCQNQHSNNQCHEIIYFLSDLKVIHDPLNVSNHIKINLWTTDQQPPQYILNHISLINQ